MSLSIITFSCDEEDIIIEQQKEENPLPEGQTGDPGVLNLSKYVSIGNSLTAGFMDNALYTDGQNHSFPKLLANQFAIEGVVEGTFQFNQPDINSANGYSGVSGGTILGRYELSLAQQRPVPTVGEAPTPYSGDKALLNNFGVPGMKITDALSPAFVSNGLYARFATNPGTSTVLGDALATSPTFFTYWLGSNDILGYAIGGGVNASLITSQPDFQAALEQSLGALVQSGAQGVVLTLPPMVLLPYFRAVPYNAIPMTDPAVVSALNTNFAQVNGVFDLLAANSIITQTDADRRKVQYQLGANPILMHDDALTDLGPIWDQMVNNNQMSTAQRTALEPYRQSRPATSSDLPVLTSATVLGTNLMVGGQPVPNAVYGVSYPVPDNLVLSVSEFQTVVGMTATYNATIAGVVQGINAQANGSITLVDVQPAFADLFGLSPALATALFDPSNGTNPALAAMASAAAARADGVLGIEVEGHLLRPDFAPNGVFSTDGVHPNPRGNGIIANLIIDALNTSKGATIPRVNVTALRGIIATDL